MKVFGFIITLFFYLGILSSQGLCATSFSLEMGAGSLYNGELFSKSVRPLGVNYQIQYGLTSPKLEFGIYVFKSNLKGKINHDSDIGQLISKTDSLGAYMLIFQQSHHFELAIGKANFQRSASDNYSKNQETAILKIFNLEREEDSLEFRAALGYFLWHKYDSSLYVRFSAHYYNDLKNTELSARFGYKYLFR